MIMAEGKWKRKGFFKALGELTEFGKWTKLVRGFIMAYLLVWVFLLVIAFQYLLSWCI